MATYLLDALVAKHEQHYLSTTQLESNMKLALKHAAEVTRHDQSSSIDFLCVFQFALFPLKTLLESSPCSRAICCIVNFNASNEPRTNWIAFFINKSNQMEMNQPILEFVDYTDCLLQPIL